MDTIQTVHSRWPFTGEVTVHVEDGSDDIEPTILIEVRRPDGQYTNVTVPKAEFMLAVRAADGDPLAAHRLRFLKDGD